MFLLGLGIGLLTGLIIGLFGSGLVQMAKEEIQDDIEHSCNCGEMEGDGSIQYTE